MKVIFKIAQTELRKLFYSPVAWFILVIFTFQSSLFFTGSFGGFVLLKELGSLGRNITHMIYSGQTGLYSLFSNYLYLYIPLLTMGIMSRELSSGSVKLLYSSPVTNRQIIIGKYFSLMAFGFILTCILGVFVFWGGITIVHADVPQVCCGLLGIYLLICAYSAIGLFVSTLTPYMVVAAMGTLGIFALLFYVKNVGQDIEWIRDITYWFALSGRVNTFIMGMVTSEDVLYFLIVIALFLSLTLLKLHSTRQKVNWLISTGRYALVILVVMFLGYFSSLPQLKFYLDATYAKDNTLTKGSQPVIKHIPDYMTITTYVNVLDPNFWLLMPDQYKADVERFDNYRRFNPSIKMKYVYFYHKTTNERLDKQYPKLNERQRFDTLKKIMDWNFTIHPYSEIANEVNLAAENFRSVRVIESPDGRKIFLRFFDDSQYFPNEKEISAAFKHFVTKLPKVGFLTGQNERSTADYTDRGYNMITCQKLFRYALINQGFDFENLRLDKPVPDDIRIMVIAEMKRALTLPEKKNLDDFISRGGNMLIMGEPGRANFMNSVTGSLGVNFLPGVLAHAPGKTLQTEINSKVAPAGASKFWFLQDLVKYNEEMLFTSAAPMEVIAGKGFNVIPWFTTKTDSCWSELQTTNFIDDTAKYDPAAGEVKKTYPAMLSLDRMVGRKQQRIVVVCDADWLSFGELNKTVLQINPANYSLEDGLFYWLSNGEVPIDDRRPDPIDGDLRIGKSGWAIAEPALKWVFPALLALTGIIIWIRRRGR